MTGSIPILERSAMPQPRAGLPSMAAAARRRGSQVAILTGGGDKPYATGIATALSAEDIPHDFIGSNELDVPEIRSLSQTVFLNLRGDQNPKASFAAKMRRILAYYARLLAYGLVARPKVFHILWHNYFHYFDRTLLLLYYRLCGRRLIFTAHNVNTEARDARDTAFNRFSLRLQYRLVDHVFVHTRKMKQEVVGQFDVPSHKVSVIPFGINETNRQTALTSEQARERFGFTAKDKVILFFGNIAEYKGLHHLVAAFDTLAQSDSSLRLLIAGRMKCAAAYEQQLRESIRLAHGSDRITFKVEFIPDDDVEVYFKAADVLILPYTTIFQSGVLSLGYSFGIPVIAADVGSLREEIVEGETGFVCKPENAEHLASTIAHYFQSPLYQNLESCRTSIKSYAKERYSWRKVARLTADVYSRLGAG